RDIRRLRRPADGRTGVRGWRPIAHGPGEWIRVARCGANGWDRPDVFAHTRLDEIDSIVQRPVTIFRLEPIDHHRRHPVPISLCDRAVSGRRAPGPSPL